jgi:hypothetical protein
MNLYEQHTPDRVIRYRQLEEAARARQALLGAGALAHRREKRTVDRAALSLRSLFRPSVPFAPRWSRAEIVSARLDVPAIVRLGGASWL